MHGFGDVTLCCSDWTASWMPNYTIGKTGGMRHRFLASHASDASGLMGRTFISR